MNSTAGMLPVEIGHSDSPNMGCFLNAPDCLFLAFLQLAAFYEELIMY